MIISENRLQRLEAFQSRMQKLFENLIEEKWNDEIRLNCKEAAAFLGITPNALRIRVCRRKINAEKYGEKLRFRLSDLMSSFKPLED